MWTEEEVAELMKGDLDPGVKAQLASAVSRPLPPELTGIRPGGLPPFSVPRQSEAAFQVKVVKALKASGWLVHAERAAWSKKGWNTPIQGDPGWFDIVAIHPVRHEVLLLELKSDAGKLSPLQEKWIMAANQCPVVKVLIVRPKDMADLLSTIEGIEGAHVPNLIERASYKCAWVNRKNA